MLNVYALHDLQNKLKILHENITCRYHLGTEQQKYGFIIGEDHKNVKKMTDPPP